MRQSSPALIGGIQRSRPGNPEQDGNHGRLGLIRLRGTRWRLGSADRRRQLGDETLVAGATVGESVFPPSSARSGQRPTCAPPPHAERTDQSRQAPARAGSWWAKQGPNPPVGGAP